MHRYSLTHLSDDALSHALTSAVRTEGEQLAVLLAHLGEFRARRLYAAAGYSSMHAYCLGRLRYSRDAAFRRVRAARAAMRFPAILAMIADRRLHLTGVVLLAPHLTESNAHELLAAAVHQGREAIEALIARHFPQPDVPARVLPLAPAPALDAPAAAPKVAPAPLSDVALTFAAPVPPPAAAPAPRVTPLAPERYALQLTIAQGTREKLRRAQELLGFSVNAGDLAAVLDRALDALVEKLEKQKRAATSHPRPARAAPANPRSVPAHVRRAVWARDRGRCTFKSDDGHRCDERSALELDHARPVARGGEASLDNLRLRCRAHNRLEAERAFGPALVAAHRGAP